MEPITITLIAVGAILLLGLVIGFFKSRSASKGSETVSFENPEADGGPARAGEANVVGVGKFLDDSPQSKGSAAPEATTEVDEELSQGHGAGPGPTKHVDLNNTAPGREPSGRS